MGVHQGAHCFDGPSRQAVDPALQIIEVRYRESDKRYRVDVGAGGRLLMFPHPPREYEVVRVQISNGPFLSMAELSIAFHVEPEAVTHSRRWRLAV